MHNLAQEGSTKNFESDFDRRCHGRKFNQSPIGYRTCCVVRLSCKPTTEKLKKIVSKKRVHFLGTLKGSKFLGDVGLLEFALIMDLKEGITCRSLKQYQHVD